MPSEIEIAVRQLLRDKGTQVLQQPDLLRGLLNDRCPHLRTEINLLLRADEWAAITTTLLKPNYPLSQDVLRENLIRRLRENHAMDAERARWATDVWIFALDLAPIQQTPIKLEETPIKLEETPAKIEETPLKLEKIPVKRRRWKTPLWIGVGVLAIASLFGVYRVMFPPVPEIQSFEFYESDRYRGPRHNTPVGDNRFRQDQTRAIMFKLSLTLPVSGETTVDELWREPDGKEKTFSLQLQKDERLIEDGRGYEGVGSWQTGTHTVEVRLQGRPLGSRQFVIEPAPPGAPLVKSIGLFEYGLGRPPESDSLYRTHFFQEATRFVNYQIDLARPLTEQLDYEVNWRLPTGMPRTFNYKVVTGEQQLYNGFGDKDGNFKWPLGDYFVDFISHGVVFATKKFTIEEPLTVSNVRFYEGEGNSATPPTGETSASFDAATSRFVWVALTLSRPVTETTPLWVFWNRPDNTSARNKAEVQSGQTVVTDARGAALPGSLIPGPWTVRVVLDNKTITTGNFMMRGPTQLPDIRQPSVFDDLFKKPKPSTNCCPCGPELTNGQCFLKCNALLPRCSQ